MLRRRLMEEGGVDLSNFVDLDLPSGTLWAKGNICKNSNGKYYLGGETEYGCYFSWGNTDGHNEDENYTWASGINNPPYVNSPGRQYMRTSNEDISSTDVEHNAPLACLGWPCDLPTKKDLRELIDHCDHELCTINGVSGIKIMRNSKYIFIPNSGYYTVPSLGTYSKFWGRGINFQLISNDFPSGARFTGGTTSGNSLALTYIDPEDGSSIRPVIHATHINFLVNLFVEIYPETDDVTSFVPNTDFEVICAYNNTFKTLYEFKAGTSYPITKKDGSYYILLSPDKKVIEIDREDYSESTYVTLAVVFPNGYDGQEVIGTFNDGTEYITQNGSSLYTSEINGQYFICTYDGTYSNGEDVDMSI